MKGTYGKKSCSKILLLLSILSVFMILSACSNKLGEVKQVDVYKMESFDQVQKNSVVTFKSDEEIKAFEQAFTHLQKQKGKVDIMDPEYKVELGDKSYFMWLNQEKVAVMDTEDTETLYLLAEDYSKCIKKIMDSTK